MGYNLLIYHFNSSPKQISLSYPSSRFQSHHLNSFHGNHSSLLTLIHLMNEPAKLCFSSRRFRDSAPRRHSESGDCICGNLLIRRWKRRSQSASAHRSGLFLSHPEIAWISNFSQTFYFLRLLDCERGGLLQLISSRPLWSTPVVKGKTFLLSLSLRPSIISIMNQHRVHCESPSASSSSC